MYLHEKRKKIAEKKAKKEEVRESKKGNREKVIAERVSNPHIVYGLGHNSLMLRINKQTMNKWINHKYEISIQSIE